LATDLGLKIRDAVSLFTDSDILLNIMDMFASAFDLVLNEAHFKKRSSFKRVSEFVNTIVCEKLRLLGVLISVKSKVIQVRNINNINITETLRRDWWCNVCCCDR